MTLATSKSEPVICRQCGRKTERKSRRQVFCSDACKSLGRRPSTSQARKTHTRPLFQKSRTNPLEKASYYSRLPVPENASERCRLKINAKQVEYFGGGQWQAVASPDGVVCYVTRIFGKAAQ